MSRHYQPYSPEQPHLLPPCPQDWMPSDHVAYLVRDLVSELDLEEMHRLHRKDARGASPFDPAMMTGILLYAWVNGVFSSRQIAALCVCDLGGRYLAAGHRPDFRTVSAFRLANGEALAGLFKQSVRLCAEAGMVSLGQVAVDGTKLAANASKHKAMSYGRLTEAEERLSREIADYQRRCLEADAAEDALYGKDASGPSVPEELKFREGRLARIRAAREAIEKEAREAAEAKAKARAERECDPEKPRRGRPAKDPDPTPGDTAQRNFTDPESRIMQSGTGEWVQGYNGQAAVDRDHQVIVACDLTNQAADSPHFRPLMEQVAANTGCRPASSCADAGYFSAANVESQLGEHTRICIPPDRMRHADKGDPADRVATEDPLSVADWMRLLLSTEEGAEEYAWRKKTVEPVFGQIKGCPGSAGFRQFLRRGLRKAYEEWRWVCATHNFRKLFRFRSAMTAAA